MRVELCLSFRYYVAHCRMKRVSVTLDDDLEVALEDYIRSQEVKPSLTAVVQAALQQFLRRHAQDVSVRITTEHRQGKRKIPK
jgi:metal-responsive CopG/Arc/MetJ family transcriptional regulator